MTRLHKKTAASAWLIGYGLIAAFVLTSFAQRVLEMRGFKYSEYYDAPQETRLKVRLIGATARPMDKGFVQVNGAKVETFRPDGLPELVVETPECTHDSSNHTIFSAGPLQVKTADGSFSIKGDGFLYAQESSTLYISNNVETVATPELLKEKDPQSPPEAPGSPMEIQSHSFRYSAEDGLGLYKGNVRVTGTNMGVTSGVLTLKLPIDERRLRSIVAEENVRLDYAETKAAGDKVVYNVDTEVAEVTGSPSWTSQGREGKADVFIIDRTNRVAHARGNAILRVPGDALTRQVMPDLSTGANEAKSAKIDFVEVRSDHYSVRTNHADFQQEVLVSELAGTNALGKLSCDNMQVYFAGTNELERLEAAGHTVLEREESRFTCDTATYTASNGIVLFQGNPAWQAGTRTGHGDVISVDVDKAEMRVSGNATMEMPAEALQQTMPMGPKKTNAPVAKTATTAIIRSKEYTVNRKEALFGGGVTIDHPQVLWSCQRLSVELPGEGKHVERVHALEDVAFTYSNDQGQKVVGKGQSALYTFNVLDGRTNEWMQLTGNPVIETTRGEDKAVFRNPVINYDMARNVMSASGHYSFKGTAPAINTNRFRLPK